MARLLAIPKELQLSVAEYITMNEDRKSLCLTCKALQELMTPLLYKDMVKCGDMLFDWPVLTARAASLQTVSIADDYIDNSVTLTHRDMEGFSAVCEAASSLEQLDVTCPCIAKERWDAPRGFVSFLDCLTRVTTLKILRLHIYPSRLQIGKPENDCADLHVLRGEMHMLALRHTMKTAVDKIFQTFLPTCPGLLGVIFHVAGDWAYEPPAFVRTKQIDPVGQVTYVGTPIKARLIKRYEPCFDLLNPSAFVYD